MANVALIGIASAANFKGVAAGWYSAGGPGPPLRLKARYTWWSWSRFRVGSSQDVAYGRKLGVFLAAVAGFFGGAWGASGVLGIRPEDIAALWWSASVAVIATTIAALAWVL